MPQRTVYVRDDDLDKWNSVQKKSELIHDALSSVDIRAYNRAKAENAEIRRLIDKTSQKFSAAARLAEKPEASDTDIVPPEEAL